MRRHPGAAARMIHTRGTSPMSKQLLSEPLKHIAALASRVPSNRREGSVGPQAIWRWCVRGVKRKDGVVVRLESLTVSGRLMSSEAALSRFFEAQQAEPVA